MIDIDQVATARATGRDHNDAGSAVGWAIGVLSAILAGLLVFVGIKYLAPADENTASPTTPTTPAASSTPTDTQTPTPAVNTAPFTGLWSGIVTGDYTPGYTATVDITQNGLAITGDVNYTYVGDASHDPMDCVGTWSGTVDGNYVDVHETMQGTRCTSGVDLRLQLNANGTILMQILYVNDSHHPVATLTQIGDD